MRRSAATVALMLGCLTAPASELMETDDFADAIGAVEEYAQRYGPEQTLLVVDIDNTLLAMTDPLGSDQWFEWQEHLLDHEPDSPHLVADDFDGLLEAQGLLFSLGKMRPPQPDQPALFARAQSLGVPTLLLTSRGPDFRVATLRELVSNGYDFAKSALAVEGVPPGEHLPYDPADYAASGWTEDEARRFGLGKPRPVLFERGVFLTAGQHKGAMLLKMLHHHGKTPRAVVFVDDHGRHVSRVYGALVQRGIEVTSVHYGREDVAVKRFRYGDKRDVTRRWQRLEAAIGGLTAKTPGADSTGESAPSPAAN